MNEVMLTEKQQAEALHKQITGYGEVIYQSLYGMCTAIKQMRDSKLYRALGYDTFEAYTEEKLGMKRRQAYNYIQIADQLSEDFVQPVAQIGMRKLLMLTALTDEQRTEITETVDLESVTVRELQAQLNALRKEKQTAEAAVTEAKEAQERTRATLRNIIDRKAEQVKSLEERVQELESRPADVAVVDHTEEIDKLNAEIARLQEQLSQRPDTQLALGVEPIYQQDSKAVFKPYLTNAVDALNRLTVFMEQHRYDDAFGFFAEKLESVLQITQTKINDLKGELQCL